MDRDTRILYRQRGSNLRRTVDEDNILVIRTPAKLSTDINSMNDLPSPPPQMDDMPVYKEDNILPEEPVFKKPRLTSFPSVRNPEPYPDVELTFDQNAILESQYEKAPLNINFSAINQKRLATSDNSLQSIEVIKHLFDNLFKENLAHRALSDFNRQTDPVRKMMYKIDLRIFEKIVEDLDNDLDDIKDINKANNGLIRSLEKTKRRKENLTIQLLKTKTELNNLMVNENWWYENKDEQLELNNRLRLNKELHCLSKTLATSVENPSNSEGKVLNNKLDSLIDVLDPQDGLLSRIDDINRKLQHQLT